MVDTTKAMESAYINADLVRESPTKKCVILDEGQYETGTFEGKTFEKFSLTVEIDGKRKSWGPNKDSVKNIAGMFGRDSKLWLGKIISLQIARVAGKDSVIGVPMPEPKVSLENV